jgi:hypothetical protein
MDRDSKSKCRQPVSKAERESELQEREKLVNPVLSPRQFHTRRVAPQL